MANKNEQMVRLLEQLLGATCYGSAVEHHERGQEIFPAAYHMHPYTGMCWRYLAQENSSRPLDPYQEISDAWMLARHFDAVSTQVMLCVSVSRNGVFAECECHDDDTRTLAHTLFDAMAACLEKEQHGRA